MVKQALICVIISFLLHPSVSYSDNSVALKKGIPAPYDGYLVDEEKMKGIIYDIEKMKVLEELSRVDQTIIEKQQITIERFKKKETSTKYEKYIMFGVGVLFTGLIVKMTK